MVTLPREGVDVRCSSVLTQVTKKCQISFIIIMIITIIITIIIIIIVIIIIISASLELLELLCHAFLLGDGEGSESYTNPAVEAI